MRIAKIVCVIVAFLLQFASSQTVEVKAKPLTDSDIQLLRSDLQAQKNEIIAHNMQFTDPESTAFWPIYREYSRDQQLARDERLQLIKDYAQNCDAMDDAKAESMVQRLLHIEAKLIDLRQQYWPKFEKALGAKRAAKFFQIDNRLSLLFDAQLASEIPFVR